jgi:hypothetical protein
MEILDLKITSMKDIDLSDRIYYYAKIKKDNKKFICQMATDGIIYPHMTSKQFIEYIKNNL